MSATDDAFPHPAPRAPRAAPIALAAVGLAIGAFAAATLVPGRLPSSVARFESEVPWTGGAPDADGWPRPPRAGESAVARGGASGGRLRVAGPDAGEVAALAAAMAWERGSGAAEDAARGARLAEAIDAERFTGPLYRLAPEAECAALLRANARVARGLAAPPPDGAASPPDAAERVTSLAIEEAARSGDPRILDDALEACRIVERERLARDAADPAAAAELRPRWEIRMHRLAGELERHAQGIEAELTPLQRELAAIVAPAAAHAALGRYPIPSAVLGAASPPPRAPRVRPIAGLRAALGAVGALLGAGLGLGLGRLAPAGRTRTAAGGTASPDGRDPGHAREWLQIVCGRHPRWVARAVMELAARGSSAGARVLVVDAGRSLALHRAFRAEAGPGLVECLARALPVLGVVQRAGVPRVLLLAHGGGSRRPEWTQLDRMLEEVRPHCDRLVLALASDVPREVGSMIAGRLADAWWAGPDRRGADLGRAAARLGIAFRHIELGHDNQPSLEVIPNRAPAPAAPARPAPAIRPAAEILETDLQVRERLRFLAWMRRVQAEGRRGELVGSSNGADVAGGRR